ncbi:MAG: hypothetical protein WDW36_005988 [Sanguina aurantia]
MGKTVAHVSTNDPERLRRVLDAKYRTIGVDTQALAGQVQERKDSQAVERERDEAFCKLSQYFDDQLTIQQQQADQIRREYNRDVQSFRTAGQLKDTRREWDLNRPDAKQIDAPARVGDEDRRNGPSSLQKFDGEDLTAGDRKTAQMGQARDWWDDQKLIKEAVAEAARDAERSHAELVRFQDALQNAAKYEEDTIRRQVAMATVAYNTRLAQERRLAAIASKAAELSANMSELQTTSASAFMTEDPNMATSAVSSLRVRKDHYKGMTEAEKQAVLDAQLAQMEEEEGAQGSGRPGRVDARQVEEFRRNQAARSSGILRKQQEEKASRDKELKALYQNAISPEYFQQFGTSHR